MEKDSQPYLSNLYSKGEVTLSDFSHLCLPPGATEKYRLLWLMATTGWEPTPREAQSEGFSNLRDTVRHLRDSGVKIKSIPEPRRSPFSGQTCTERYSLLPESESLQIAFGLLRDAGISNAGDVDYYS